MTKEQRREYNRRYREDHKEEIIERSKIYRKNHREKLNKLAREHYAKNKDRINANRRKNYDSEKAREYREKNKDIILQRHREYYKNNIEKARKQGRDWYHRNKKDVAIRASIRKCNKDFSPNQNNMENMSRLEKRRYVHERTHAVQTAHKNNRYSNRRGVRWDIRDKKWWGYMVYNGKRIVGKFNTEEEATAYREFLENTYYTPEQLRIRDKYGVN